MSPTGPQYGMEVGDGIRQWPVEQQIEGCPQRGCDGNLRPRCAFVRSNDVGNCAVIRRIKQTPIHGQAELFTAPVRHSALNGSSGIVQIAIRLRMALPGLCDRYSAPNGGRGESGDGELGEY
jgi:hypothetical protein